MKILKMKNIGLRIKVKVWNGINGIIYNISYKITDKFDQKLYLELWNEIEIRDGGFVAIGGQIRDQTLELFLNT